ncbi:hypothetical protein NDU88_004240 [Pleurodeles waltl]|uniref:Uncharacterized protein n=1 Tax=Pleurodeles waltl TaxID=8319 RepID=A0AAV7W7P5_PLEWA|nr:hypothetical protein NDU88_004240 [Pleurodeles waltl]
MWWCLPPARYPRTRETERNCLPPLAEREYGALPLVSRVTGEPSLHPESPLQPTETKQSDLLALEGLGRVPLQIGVPSPDWACCTAVPMAAATGLKMEQP